MSTEEINKGDGFGEMVEGVDLESTVLEGVDGRESTLVTETQDEITTQVKEFVIGSPESSALIEEIDASIAAGEVEPPDFHC